MTTVRVPDDYPTLQEALDAAGGPGVTIKLAKGEFLVNIHLDNSNPRHSGEVDNPLRIEGANSEDTTLRPAIHSKDTIRIEACHDIVLEGMGIHGPTDDSRQAVHMHRSSKENCDRIKIRKCRVWRRGGDGVKASEVYNLTLERTYFLSDHVPSGAKESAIDLNKVRGATVDRCDVEGEPNLAFVVKGGSEKITLTKNDFTARKPAEIGGYYGSGPWPDHDGNWAVRGVIMNNNTFRTWDDQHPVRFMSAWDVRGAGNDLSGYRGIGLTDTGDKDGNEWRCQNILLQRTELKLRT